MRTFLRACSWGVLTVVLVALVTVARPSWLLDGPSSTLIVSGHSMDGTYRNGDLILTHRRGAYSVGDIVGFQVPDGEAGAGMVVIHRIVGLRDGRFTTQGDNNPELDPWTIDEADIRGEAVLRITGVGSLGSVLRGPVGLAGVFGSLAAWVAMGAMPKRKPATPDPDPAPASTPLAEPVRRPRAATSPPAS